MIARSLILLMAMVAGLATPVSASAGLFGSREVRSAQITLFPKWTGMLSRRETPVSLPTASDCVPNPRFPCPQPFDLGQFVRDHRDLPVDAQIEAVNSTFNRTRYVTDPINWRLPDYWATLMEFLRRDGDCEDYAIAKYTALKALGFPASQMRIVVVQDENLGVPHAVLEVTHQGERLILDNQAPVVMPHTAIAHYRPLFSINESAWWLHQNAAGVPYATVLGIGTTRRVR
jgi:predicted transglutaminase-like cysteine proteinase